MEDC